jgi:hypothetical protein
VPLCECVEFDAEAPAETVKPLIDGGTWRGFKGHASSIPAHRFTRP